MLVTLKSQFEFITYKKCAEFVSQHLLCNRVSFPMKLDEMHTLVQIYG